MKLATMDQVSASVAAGQRLRENHQDSATAART